MRVALSLFISTALLLPTCLPAQPQVCPPGALQLQIDALPQNPAGQQPVAVIAGLCPGDKAAVVFDIGGLPQPLKVLRGGALFVAGQCLFAPPQAATARLEIYDGVQFNGQGNALLGPMIYSSPAPFSLAVNTFTSVDISAANVTANASKLVIAFEIVSNPNEIIPFGGCQFGYCANLCADTNVPAGSPCSTRPGTNLIYDTVTQAWWDITSFQIGGTNFCGVAFNGNWVVRACVELPTGAYLGTGEDFTLVSAVGSVTLTPAVAKSVTTGNVVTVMLDSPGQTLANSIAFWILDIAPSAGPPPLPVAPGTWVGANFVYAGPFLLPGSGTSLALPIPANSFGTTYLLQGVLISPLSANGLYSTTNAHALWSY